MSPTRSWVGRGENHDRRTILGAGSHLGPEAALHRPRDQVLRERSRHPANSGDADFVDVIEAPELRVDRRERRRAELETPRVVVQLERVGVEGELVLVAEPPGNSGSESPCDLITRSEEHTSELQSRL